VVVETDFWQTHLKRHLTTFKVTLIFEAGTRLSTFVTAGSGAAVPRTYASGNSFALFDCTLGRL
jgi:hypothetical protein